MRKKITKIIIALLSLCCAQILGCAKQDDVYVIDGNTYTATLTTELSDSYAYGVTLNIPEATIFVDGDDVATHRYAVIYPNGVVKNTESVVLDVSGEYKIVYYATVDGKTVTAEKTFDVLEYDQTTDAPVINISGDFMHEEIAYSALNESITLPFATAVSNCLVGGVDVKVYYNYGTSRQVQIGLTNNSFTPNVAGEYTIIYCARDYFGSIAQVKRSVLVSKTDTSTAVQLSVGMPIEITAGSEVTVPICMVSGLYNDISRLKIYARFGDEQIEVKDNKFFAKYVGAYTIVYEYETPIKTYYATLKINSVSNGTVLFDEYHLPQYFIKGASYTLDDVYAVSYTSENPTRSKAEYYASFDGAAYQKVDNNAVAISGNETVRFKFAFGGKKIETDAYQIIDVGHGGEINLKQYFVGDVISSATYEGAHYVTTRAANEITLDFINVLSLSSFSIDTIVPSVKLDDSGNETLDVYGKTSSIKFRIIDYYKRDNVAEIRYINEGGSATLSINGARAQSLYRDFYDTQHKLQYDVSRQVFRDLVSTQSYAYDNNFTTDKVLLQIVIEDCEQNACLTVSGIGNQFIDDSGVDGSRPNIYVFERQAGSWKLNDEVVLYAATVTDELTPYLRQNLKFEVKSPSGYAVSVDGVNLSGDVDVHRDYVLKLDEYGVYTVKYSYTDQNGISDAVSYSIFVYNTVSPTIRVSGVEAGYTAKVKAGATVILPKYSATDDVTAKSELISYVSVFTPKAECIRADDLKFVTMHKGTYRVVYYSCDADGNYATFTIYVVAE